MHRDSKASTAQPRLPAEKFTSDAFLSYSHAEDHGLSARLQASLENFARPIFRGRSMRIYRDETNLAARPDLWGAIKSALDGSRKLILLASPRSARSQWVPKEVRHFVNRRGRENVCIIQTLGELPWTSKQDEPFDFGSPKSAICEEVFDLLNPPGDEPLIVDLRPFREGAVERPGRRAEYESKVAAIAAEVLGRDKDELYGEHLKRARRARAIALIVALALLLLAGTTVYAGLGFRDQAIRATRTLSRVYVEKATSHAERRESARAKAFFAAALAGDDRPQTRARILEERALGASLLWRSQSRASGEVVAFSPDERQLAIARADGRIELWDFSNRRLLRTLPGHGAQLSALAYSHDGRLLASVAGEEAGLWSVASGRRVVKFTIPRGGVHKAAFSVDDRSLVTTQQWGIIAEWSVPNGKRLRGRNLGDQLMKSDISADGKLIARASYSGRITVELSSGEREILRWNAPLDGQCDTLAFNGNATHLAAVCGDHNGWVWNLQKPLADPRTVYVPNMGPETERMALLDPSDGQEDPLPLFGLFGWTVSPLGRWTFLNGRFHSVGAETDSFSLGDGPAEEITGIVFSPDGEFLAATSGRELWLLDSASGRELSRGRIEACDANPFFTPGGLGVGVRCPGLAPQLFVPSRPTLTTAKESPLTNIRTGFDFDRQTGDIVAPEFDEGTYSLARNALDGPRVSPWHDGIGRRFAVDATGRMFADRTFDTIALQPANTPQRIALIDNSQGVSTFVFTPDGESLVSRIHSEVVVWNVNTRTVTQSFKIPGQSYIGLTDTLAIDPSGTRVAVATKKEVLVWHLGSGTLLFRFNYDDRPMHQPRAVAFGPDGFSFVIGFRDATIERWSLGRSPEARMVSIAENSVEDIAFSPDEQAIAVALSGVRLRPIPNTDGMVEKGYGTRVLAWDASFAPIDIAPLALEGYSIVWPTPSLLAATGTGFREVSVQFSTPGDTSWESRKTTLGTDDRQRPKIVASDNGRLLAVSTTTEGVREHHVLEVWDTVARQPHREVRTGACANGGMCPGPTDAMDFHPLQSWLAYGGLDDIPRVWDYKENRDVPPALAAHASLINAVRFLTDGRLVTASDDGEVRVWTEDRTTYESFNYSDEIVAVSRSGRLLVKTDEGLELWRRPGARNPVLLRGMRTPVRFSRNETRLATTVSPYQKSSEGVLQERAIVVWDLGAVERFGDNPAGILSEEILTESGFTIGEDGIEPRQ